MFLYSAPGSFLGVFAGLYGGNLLSGARRQCGAYYCWAFVVSGIVVALRQKKKK